VKARTSSPPGAEADSHAGERDRCADDGTSEEAAALAQPTFAKPTT